MDAIDKVQALLRKTVANGCTPHEQASSMMLARSLVNKYKLATSFTWPKPPSGWVWVGNTLQAIERFADKLRRRKKKASIDFESRSAADIRNGPWAYSIHPSTRILCLAFTLPDQDPDDPSIWVAPLWDGTRMVQLPHHYPAHPDGGLWDLDRLFDYVRKGGLVEAHNVAFERAMWENLFTKPYSGDEYGAIGRGAPHLKDTQLRCSAAKAAAFALPRPLGQAGHAMKLGQLKDEEGSRVMLAISKARKPRKTEPTVNEWGDPIWYYRAYNRSELERMYEYCRDDIRAEHALSESLPDLSDHEYKVWLADLRANWRGVAIDRDLVLAAIDLDSQVKAELNKELEYITLIERGTARGQILDWLQKEGLAINDTTAGTLDWWMARADFTELKPDVQRVIEIARNINRTSITKYKRILACMDPRDNRVRDLVMYHGAATGRWSGKGIQVQNFPRGVLGDLVSSAEPGGTKAKVKMEQAVADVKTRDLAWCKAVYGDVLALLSSVARGALVPGPGRVFYVADYSAIEARVVLWLAGAKSALEVFKSTDPEIDIYTDMASTIYGRPIRKSLHKDERQFGKVTILGLGYGMGFLTFLLNIRTYDLAFTKEQAMGIMGAKADKYIDWVTQRMWPTQPGEDATDEEVRKYKAAKRQAAMDLHRLRDAREEPVDIVHELAVCKFVVDTYRAKYPEVPELWQAQEAAAIQAVMDWEAERDRCAKLGITDPNLFDLKPVVAGKVTWYVDNRWLFCQLPSGRCLAYTDPFIKWQRTPWGSKRPELRFQGVHKKLKRWAEMSTYGGSVVENETQATARDMMAWAFVTVDEHELYDPVASIHDELLSEGDEATGDYKQYESLIVDLPDCYEGCPVAAEGDMLHRYQK